MKIELPDRRPSDMQASQQTRRCRRTTVPARETRGLRAMRLREAVES